MTRRDLGTIRSIGKGIWRVEVSAGRDSETGKRVRPTATVRGSRQEAAQELARLALEYGKGKKLKQSMTLASYISDVYLPFKEKKRRTRTVQGYEEKLRLYVTPYIGHIQLADLDSQIIDNWLAKLEYEKAQLSERTMAHAYTALHTALRQAVKWNYLALDPMSGTDRPQVSERDLTVWNAKIISQALDAFRGDEIELVVVLALGCGMRRSEICGLTWDNVDLERGELRVVQGLHSATGRGLYLEPPKTKRSLRTISLPDWARERLIDRMGVGPVIRDKDGGLMHPDVVSARFKDRCARYELPYIPLRDLRHSHATVLIEEGVDVTIVSRRLGHSGTGITDKFYVRPGQEADQGAAAKLNRLGSYTPPEPDNVVNLEDYA